MWRANSPSNVSYVTGRVHELGNLGQLLLSAGIPVSSKWTQIRTSERVSNPLDVVAPTLELTIVEANNRSARQQSISTSTKWPWQKHIWTWSCAPRLIAMRLSYSHAPTVYMLRTRLHVTLVPRATFLCTVPWSQYRPFPDLYFTATMMSSQLKA